MGLTVKYNKNTNQRLGDYKKNKQRESKTKVEDDTDAASNTNRGLVKKHNGTEYYTAVTNKKKDEAIQKNLDEQSKSAGGAGKRVAGGLSCFAQSKENYFGFSDVSTNVDATTAVNSVNTSNLQGYFQTVVTT